MEHGCMGAWVHGALIMMSLGKAGAGGAGSMFATLRGGGLNIPVE